MTPSTTTRTIRVVIDAEVLIDGRIDDPSVVIHECGMLIASAFPTGHRWDEDGAVCVLNSTSVVSIAPL